MRSDVEHHETALTTTTASTDDLPGAELAESQLTPHRAPSSAPARGRSQSQNVNLTIAGAQFLQQQCLKLCIALFYRERHPVRSLGFTSAVASEGKSSVALASALALARATEQSVTILDLNWSHPSLHAWLDLPQTPGVAEYLRGGCSASEIRHQVRPNLTAIPAGNGAGDHVRLLHALRQTRTRDELLSADEPLIVDLPSILTCSYGTLAASLVEAIVMVVRAGSTSEAYVTQACAELEGLPVEGLLLNAVHSRVPRWLQQLL